MYLDPTKTYYVGSTQHAARGRFLCLLQSADSPCGPDNMRGIVRRVALRQLGMWMMGRVTIGGTWYGVSGPYGHDGLPMTVPEAAFLRGVPLPADLYAAWNDGGGHNAAGKEEVAMRTWAHTIA